MGGAGEGRRALVLALLACGGAAACASVTARPEPPPAPPPAPTPAPPADQARAAAPDDGSVARRHGPVSQFDAPPPGGVPSAPPTTFLFPPGPLLYDPYLAAQRQSRTAVKLLHTFGPDQHERIETVLGTVRSLVRWKPEDGSDTANEVEFEAAVFSRFDVHRNYDQEASDWRFGIPIVHRDGDFAWKLHLYHLSSHLGDDTIERTGRKPLQYHLDEAAGGLSWDASGSSRVYGEVGYALYASAPTYNGRVEAGYEWAGRKWRSGFAPFVALDLQARKEQNWAGDLTFAVGVAYARSFRLSLEYYRGRDTQTQFLDRRLQWVAMGLSFDF